MDGVGERVETVLDLGRCKLTRVIGSAPMRMEVQVQAFRPGATADGRELSCIGHLLELLSQAGMVLRYDGEGWLWGSAEVGNEGQVLMEVTRIIGAFGLQRDSRLAALLMIGSAQICSVMNIGVLTAAAQNATFLGLIGRAIPGATVTWLDWFIAALRLVIIDVLRLPLLDVTRVTQHDVGQFPGGMCAIDRSRISLLDQVREVARMVDVRV